MSFLALMPRWAWFAIGGVLVALALVLALHSYGNSRYKAGKADADAAWVAASNKLIDKAQKATVEGDTKAAARAADFAARQEAEKAKIDAAQKNGDSPFDVMFGNAS